MSFWTQLLINAILGGGLSAAVGVPVAFIVKRSLRDLFSEQQRTTNAAEAAASRAGDAADASHQAARHAADTALELKAANGRSVGVLPPEDHALEYLKETNSRLVATLVIQASKHPEDFDSPSAPRFPAPADEDGEEYVTGRHALREPASG